MPKTASFRKRRTRVEPTKAETASFRKAHTVNELTGAIDQLLLARHPLMTIGELEPVGLALSGMDQALGRLHALRVLVDTFE